MEAGNASSCHLVSFWNSSSEGSCRTGTWMGCGLGLSPPHCGTWGPSVPSSLRGLPWDSWHGVTHWVALLGSQGQLGGGCGQIPRVGAGEKAVGLGTARLPPGSAPATEAGSGWGSHGCLVTPGLWQLLLQGAVLTSRRSFPSHSSSAAHGHESVKPPVPCSSGLRTQRTTLEATKRRNGLTGNRQGVLSTQPSSGDIGVCMMSPAAPLSPRSLHKAAARVRENL